MYFGLGDPQLYLSGLLFLLAVLLSWFVPGWVALSQFRWKDLSLKLVLALPVGVAFWGAQGYIFGYLGVRLLTFAYLFAFTLLFLREQRRTSWKEFRQLAQRVKKVPVWLFILVILSAVFQVFAHVGSGLRIAEGIPFYFVNSVDGVMHLAYIQELAQRFPPQEPGAIGVPLVNYHYWSDLVVADLTRIWQLPIIHLFFQFVPFLLALWTTLLLIQLVRFLGGNKKAVLVSVFLLALGADATFLITQLLHGTWGEGVATFDTGVTFFFNIPQVFARFIFLGSILLVLEWWKQRQWMLGLITVILLASLFGFKVYYALYAVVGFCSLVAYEMLMTFFQKSKVKSLKDRIVFTLTRNFQAIVWVALLALFSVVLYFPTNSGAGGLGFFPLVWPRRLLSSENINYADWFLRMQVYEQAGNTRNIFIFNALAIFLTFVAIYGTRLLGIIPLFRPPNEDWKRLLALFLPANFLFLCLGLFTLQTSGGLNVYNFLIVPITSFIVILSFSLSRLTNKVFVPIFLLLVILTLPRSSLQLQDFAHRYSEKDADLLISPQELEGLEFIQRNTPQESVVQGSLRDPQNILSISLPFFSNRSSYIIGSELLRRSHTRQIEERAVHFREALEQTEATTRQQALASLGISYLYLPVEEAEELGFEPIFRNEKVAVINIVSN